MDAGSTINKIPNWEADAVSFFPNSVGNTASLGDPYFVAGATGITYSQMVTATDISRDVTSFLIKNLLPLILLTSVTYIALWLPYKDATSRISFGVTGILTGAVMLGQRRPVRCRRWTTRWRSSGPTTRSSRCRPAGCW